MIRWNEQRDLPPGVTAILSGASPHNDAEWKEALRYTDRFQLTFALVKDGPAWVRAQVAADSARNRQRMTRIFDLFRKVQEATAGSEIVVLKGFAHWDLFHLQPDGRVQYDLDLYCPDRAPDIARELQRLAPSPNYKWNGDFYDAAIPIEIDWHERLWDEKMEGFAALGVEEFWARRVWTYVEGIRFQTLAPPDALAFAGLHMLKHVLHGEARPAQALEIASFLRHRAADETFWAEWRRLHPPELRRIEAVAFRFAAEWFGCPLRKEAACLTPKVERWFERHAASPLTAYFRPNKDELALNLCLIENTAAKARVVGRRLFPAHLPQPFSYAIERGVFHLRALAPAVSTMLRMRR
jgi:hypothetical protein